VVEAAELAVVGVGVDVPVETEDAASGWQLPSQGDDVSFGVQPKIESDTTAVSAKSDTVFILFVFLC
jgi:hypothetical protein